MKENSGKDSVWIKTLSGQSFFVVCGEKVSFAGRALKNRREGGTIKVYARQAVATRKYTHKLHVWIEVTIAYKVFPGLILKEII